MYEQSNSISTEIGKNTEIEIVESNQKTILDLKSTINEMKVY